jgi:glycine reductase
MDLEGQGRIKQVVERAGTDNLVAVLGVNAPLAAEMTAITLKSGDPSYAGPLSGIALNIPSYHILESEISSQISSELYQEELALSALATNVEEIIAPLIAIRKEAT